jgi:Ras family protein A
MKPIQRKESGERARRKLVMIGDGACGKTCALVTFSAGTYPEVYIPTVFENYVSDVTVDDRHVELALWDTAGQEDYDRLRPLSYPDSHVVAITFAVDSPDSLDNVCSKWISEFTYFCRGVPMVLVGLKEDLRYDARTIKELAKTQQKPVTYSQGLAAASYIGAAAYVECSAQNYAGMGSVFDVSTRLGLYGLNWVRKNVRAKHGRRGDCSLM